MVTLYTSYYQDPNPKRQKELDYCLQKNLENPMIDRIMLYVEGDFVPHPKVTILGNHRPTYRQFFDAINEHTRHEFEISILANTDIYFDSTLQYLQLTGRECLALSRWDVKPGKETKLHNERYSQDTWIFSGKVRKVRYCDFFLGVPGCDNRIAWELSQAGYRLFNPATKIKTYHYHPSDLHTYNTKMTIPKPYLFVEVI